MAKQVLYFCDHFLSKSSTLLESSRISVNRPTMTQTSCKRLLQMTRAESAVGLRERTAVFAVGEPQSQGRRRQVRSGAQQRACWWFPLTFTGFCSTRNSSPQMIGRKREGEELFLLSYTRVFIDQFTFGFHICLSFDASCLLRR